MKLTTCVGAALLLALSSTHVMAAATSDLAFDIEATVPEHRYYVEFIDPSFGGSTQTMGWNQTDDKLDELTAGIKARNSGGNIEAKLINTAELVHDTDVMKVIPLTVAVNNIIIDEVSGREVFAAGTVDNEVSSTIKVSGPASGDASYQEGDYRGAVSISFDHAEP